MAEEEENPVEMLKQRGITCSRLKSLENDSITDSKKFREAGFVGIAGLEEQIAGKIKNLRQKVCLLK